MGRHLELLGVLADGNHHPVDELTDRLGIDRPALSALFEKLSALGAACVHAPGAGYRWSEPVALLDPAIILGSMGAGARPLVASLEVLAEIDSTNRRVVDAAQEGAVSGSVCVAECQTRGQGRRGRGFVSPIGNIYQSVLWRFDTGPAHLAGLSVAIGVAVAEACVRLGAAETGVKWPNDVLWRDRKLSGILVETTADSRAGTAAVVGVGVNFRMPERAGSAIDQSWTDLNSAVETCPDRNVAAARLCEAVLLGLDQFAREGFAPFAPRWNRLDVMRDRPVTLHVSGVREEGVAAGVDESGALLLDVNGDIRAITTGDVSLRARS